MKIVFWGAVRTVTGSRHLVRVGGGVILLDCGLFQGRRDESEERNRDFPFPPADLDAVVLSHAHIDHSGNIPSLVKRSFRGPIHATSPTVDLCGVMLRDSAHVQAKDVEFVNKRPSRRGAKARTPLYSMEDVEKALRLFRPHPYGAEIEISEGAAVTFREAGHILGSAFIDLDLRERGTRRRLVFSGDLGRRHLPIIRDPERLPSCDVLLIESTYGDRLHPPPESVPEILAGVVDRVRARGGKIIIPAFAVGRVQEIVWVLKRLIDEGRIDPIPIYVDSPLAVDATEIFARHAECFDADTREVLRTDGDPFGFRLVRYIEDVEQSKALNGKPGCSIIISPSGMCEAGRVLHHLRNNIGDPRNLVLIVGFQAENTLGSRLAERRETVRIFGEEHDLRAEVLQMDGFSAHADRDELLGWLEGAEGRPGRTFVIHGDSERSEAFAATLRGRGFPKVAVPELGREYDL